jgi:5'-3' exonuclease
MGIKHLNKFLQENCSQLAIHKSGLGFLKNKTIVIDTSIYLYKFIAENALIENMYLLVSIFKQYEITPVFIFDGKPPVEKRDLLIKRLMEKKEAEKKYNELKIKLTTARNEEKPIIIQDMEYLKRQFVRINDDDIQKVKGLMDAYGVTYYDAQGEADKLCAYLLKIGKAWACISDDMDMFLYGCPYVIRGISMLKHTCLFYDTEAILKDLEMSNKQFCEIMVLSGTDYNLDVNVSLKETINWYYEYNKYCAKCENPYGFYVWLVKNTKYIKDYKKLLNVYQIFQFYNNKELENWDNIEAIEKPMNNEALINIMKKEGFVFI